MSGVFKRLILWDYPRGVWQYDIVCAVILVFIAFTPRAWFRDQPRIPHASQITSLPSHGEGVFWIDPELVSSIPESQRLASLSKVLSAREGRPQQLVRIEPVFDDTENELKGYLGFSRP